MLCGGVFSVVNVTIINWFCTLYSEVSDHAGLLCEL